MSEQKDLKRTEKRKHRIYSDENTVTPELFGNPPVKYRGAPFWAWNCRLDPAKLKEQISCFREMGFGGFHMHARPGLDLPYMGEAFLDRVSLCVEQAEKLGLTPRLYDEDRWPSGFAGGEAVKGHPEYRRRALHFTRVAGENARTVGRYDICLNQDGTLASFRLLKSGEKAEGMEWLAQVVLDEDTLRYSNSAYIDTLNPEAVKRFISLTHERYQKKLGNRLGTTVPSIFTDEPRTPVQSALPCALGEEEAVLPWTDSLPDTFLAATGRDIVASLPELVWDLPGQKPSQLRWLYYDHVAELFAKGFFDTIGSWCDDAEIDFSGHLMDEFPLDRSVAVSGEAMRCYCGMSIPGIDMLCGLYEYTTAKQAQSVVRQMDKDGMLSELYGVIGWDGDFREHKLQGDWQAALGVTLRVPHLAWCSMQGERKRDFPQSIFYQSPWYKEYPLIEDHFARVCMAMTQGRAVCRIGVIHPIESFWLHCGPADCSRQAMERIERNWENVTEWLLFGGYDFDFISESMLPELCAEGGAPLCVGRSRYDAVVVPECETLRTGTLERLRKFRDEGGTVVFMGEPPAYADAVPDPGPKELAERSETIPFEKEAILTALREFREIGLVNADGSRASDLLYQLREDEDGRWLFLAHGKKPEKGKDTIGKEIILTLRGEWKAELYDTLSGEIRPLSSSYQEEGTVLPLLLYTHDSVLLRLTRGRNEKTEKEACGECVSEIPVPIPEENAYTLSEPNVLLLDTAQYRLDDEAWQPEEEILRLDHLCRRKLDWHGGLQPWLIPDEAPEHTLSLRFRVHSDIERDDIHLALENLQKTEIRWNGNAVPGKASGWYVDRDIRTVLLPPLKKGENILELTMPFERKVNTEWCYLLGSFGVCVQGSEKRLTEPAKALGFSDIVPQTLPFYSGKVTYHIPFWTPAGGTLSVCAAEYNAALLKGRVDDGESHVIAFAPYAMKTKVPAGCHILHLTAFINRTNGFGPVHHAGRNVSWFGQEAWKTTGSEWTYEYVLRKEGILSAPVLTLRPHED